MNSQSATSIPTLCLTHEQIADLLIADDPATLSLASRQRHLRQCPTCQAEFNQLEAALSGLRDSARTGASQEHREVSSQMRADRRNGILLARPAAPKHRAVWALGVAAVALAVALPLTHRTAPVPASGAAMASPGSPAPGAPATDEALLDGVDRDLAASVPTSLQPLADPASANSSATVSDDTSAPR